MLSKGYNFFRVSCIFRVSALHATVVSKSCSVNRSVTLDSIDNKPWPSFKLGGQTEYSEKKLRSVEETNSTLFPFPFNINFQGPVVSKAFSLNGG
jgi:hypothetical protein